MTTKPIHFNGHPLTPTDPTFDLNTGELRGWRIREDEWGLRAIDPTTSRVLRINGEVINVATPHGNFEVPMQVLDELVRRQRELVAEALGRESAK